MCPMGFDVLIGFVTQADCNMSSNQRVASVRSQKSSQEDVLSFRSHPRERRGRPLDFFTCSFTRGSGVSFAERSYAHIDTRKRFNLKNGNLSDSIGFHVVLICGVFGRFRISPCAINKTCFESLFPDGIPSREERRIKCLKNSSIVIALIDF